MLIWYRQVMFLQVVAKAGLTTLSFVFQQASKPISIEVVPLDRRKKPEKEEESEDEEEEDEEEEDEEEEEESESEEEEKKTQPKKGKNL